MGTWGGQLPNGVVGGGPRVTRRCPSGAALTLAPGRAAGAVFFPGGGSLGGKWLDRTNRRGVPILGPQKYTTNDVIGPYFATIRGMI
jgi:hypothetical protein